MPLIDSTRQVTTICCDYCSTRDTINDAPTVEAAVRVLGGKGWRQVAQRSGSRNVICPKCRFGRFPYAKTLQVLEPDE